jgi:hypothetical protein
MKSWPDFKSPWGKQIRFEDEEFESMMDEMRDRVDSDCFTPGKGVDIDLVLLRVIESEADYVELPAGIMGRTLFASDGSVKIEISRELSEEAESDRIARHRFRSTLAHECGHVACHRRLFIRDTSTLSLFSADEVAATAPVRPAMMCRAEAIGLVGYNGEWWEFQANRCMAALLLPRRMFGASTKRRLSSGGFESGEACLQRSHGESLVRELADEYDVSQTVTLYRLQQLGFFPVGTQQWMRLTD